MNQGVNAKQNREIAERRRNQRSETSRGTDGSDHVSRTTKRANWQKNFPKGTPQEGWDGVS